MHVSTVQASAPCGSERGKHPVRYRITPTESSTYKIRPNPATRATPPSQVVAPGRQASTTSRCRRRTGIRSRPWIASGVLQDNFRRGKVVLSVDSGSVHLPAARLAAVVNPRVAPRPARRAADLDRQHEGWLDPGQPFEVVLQELARGAAADPGATLCAVATWIFLPRRRRRQVEAGHRPCARRCSEESLMMVR